MVHVNIDGDVICYAVGFAGETTMYFDETDKGYANKRDALEAGADPDSLTKVTTAEPVHYVLSTAKRMIANIVKACNADTYNVVLTGKGNFREEVAVTQPYKGNRNQPKPLLHAEIREYIEKYQNAVVVDGEEADDYLAYSAIASGDVIATVDKDLDNVPGLHYNWNYPDKGVYLVTEREAQQNFHIQLLTGDSTDNIPGLYRRTGKRAGAKLKAAVRECDDAKGMYDVVHDIYMDAFMDNGMEMIEADKEASMFLAEIGQLLWMRYEPNQTWTPGLTA